MEILQDQAVDVLIVNYRSPGLTAAAAASAMGRGRRVLIWDNSGDLPALDGAEVYGDGTNHYFAAANNRLFAMGSSEYVLLLNPDVTLAAGAIEALVDELAGKAERWGVTSRLTGLDGQNQNYLHSLPNTRAVLSDRLPPLRAVFRRDFRRYECLDVPLERSTTVEQPPAALLMVRREQVVAAGGLFDEAYPLFFNDVDLARRMSMFGNCRYLADPAAQHVGGESVRAASRRGEPIAELYDAALITYARRNLPGSWLVATAVATRRALDRTRGGWWR